MIKLFVVLFCCSGFILGEYADGDPGDYSYDDIYIDDGELEEDMLDNIEREERSFGPPFGGGAFGGRPHASGSPFSNWPTKGHQFGGPQRPQHGPHMGGPPGAQMGGPPGAQMGGPPGAHIGGPPGGQFERPTGSQHGGPQGSRFGRPPGAQHGGPPGSHHGGPPGSPHGGPPGSPFGKPPGSPFVKQPGSQSGGPPGSPFGKPPGSPFVKQPGSQSGGPPGSPFGKPPGSPFVKQPGSQFGGPPGSQFGKPPGSQFGGPPHGNRMDDETDIEEMDLHLIVSNVVNNVLVMLRPVLTQALTRELKDQGLEAGNWHLHPPVQQPGFYQRPMMHTHHQDHFQDLDEFLGEEDDMEGHQYFGPPGPFGGGHPGSPPPFGMFGGQSPRPGGMFGGVNTFLGMRRNAPKETSEDDMDNTVKKEATSESLCVVKEGPGLGKECVFPFGHKGTQHNTCAYNPDQGDTYPWCSTKVDASGFHVGGQDEWGRCDPSNHNCKTLT